MGASGTFFNNSITSRSFTEGTEGPEVGGRRSEVGRRRSEVGGRRSEVGRDDGASAAVDG